MDTGYLSPSTRIWFWRFGDTITVEWDNKDKYFERIPAWAAQQCSFSLSLDQFLAEILAFRKSFLDAMRIRVEEVCQSWSRADVQIDLKQLVMDQKSHESLTINNSPDAAGTNWAAVISALNYIEKSRTSFGSA